VGEGLDNEADRSSLSTSRDSVVDAEESWFDATHVQKDTLLGNIQAGSGILSASYTMLPRR